MIRSLPKSGVFRFALIFLACEVLAWCVCSAWDARHPQYKSTVVFSVRHDRNGPVGLFGVRTFSFQPGDDDWMQLADKAADDRGATRCHISRPLFLGETNDLNDVYKHAERLIKGVLMHRYENGGEIYHFTVIASDASTASQQANRAIKQLEVSLLSIVSRRRESEEKRQLREWAEAAKEFRKNGNERAAAEMEANIRAEGAVVCRLWSAPVSIWERAVPSSQRIRTFYALLTQSLVMCLAAVVGITYRNVASKFSSIRLKPVA